MNLLSVDGCEFKVQHYVACHFFAAEAEADLQRRLGQTLPQHDLASVRPSLDCLLDLIEQDMDTITAGRVGLTDEQRGVIQAIRHGSRTGSNSRRGA